MQELTLEQIFNRTETLEYSKEYKYIEQTSVNGKPSIIAGDENLKSFSLRIKLHYSFCNPQNIIDELEEKAENREIINYFQHGVYIGDYVINGPDSITEFEQQTKTNPVIDLEQVSETSNKMQKFLAKAKDIMVSNVFDSVVSTLQDGDITALGNTGMRILNDVQNTIINEIKTAGLNKAAPIVQKYLSDLNVSNVLDATQTSILKTELSKLPDKLIKGLKQ